MKSRGARVSNIRVSVIARPLDQVRGHACSGNPSHPLSLPDLFGQSRKKEHDSRLILGLTSRTENDRPVEIYYINILYYKKPVNVIPYYMQIYLLINV